MSVSKDIKNASKIWLRNGTKYNNTSSHMLLDHCYVFGLSLKLSGLKKKFLRKGTPVTYFCPALDPPLGGSGRRTTTLEKDHEYFISTKFHQNSSSGSGEEVENVKVYGRRTTTDGRKDDGRRAMTIVHLCLRLRWANKKRGRKIINHNIAKGTRESHPSVHTGYNRTREIARVPL